MKDDRKWCHLLHVDVFLGAGLKHSDPHRLPEPHGILGLHTLPGRVVVFVSNWRRTRQKRLHTHTHTDTL